jgi:hypothetical protein
MSCLVVVRGRVVMRYQGTQHMGRMHTEHDYIAVLDMLLRLGLLAVLCCASYRWMVGGYLCHWPVFVGPGACEQCLQHAADAWPGAAAPLAERPCKCMSNSCIKTHMVRRQVPASTDSTCHSAQWAACMT